MFQKLIFLLLLPAATAGDVCGQAINNMLAYKNINRDGYVRFSYDNDFFAAKDQYYTQGIDAEVVLPAFKRTPIRYVLINPKFGYTRYGIGAQHNGYTPTSIGSNAILYGDRPFAGALMFKTFLIGIDAVKKQRFSSSLYAGVIGPSAKTREMQVSIHEALGDFKPLGWQHQINDDVALNYNIDYEKQLLAYGNYLMLSGTGGLRLGTLNTRATLGVTLMAGYFTSPFSNEVIKGDHFRIYIYDHPEVSFNGYDATLQGGMFDKTSPYTIFSKDMSGVIFRNRVGIAVNYQGFFLEYFNTIVTREFTTGKPYAYGGIQIGVGL